jgi:ribosomal protein L29
MKMNELKKLDIAAKNKLLLEKKEALARLNFSKTSVPMKNVRELRVLKKEIARILTVLHAEKPSVNK